jgi:hypothetical protein
MAHKSFRTFVFFLFFLGFGSFVPVTRAQSYQNPAAVDSSVVYQFDMSRIKDATKMRIAVGGYNPVVPAEDVSSPFDYHVKGLTLWDIFNKLIIKDAKNYCIVRVRILYRGPDITFEFLYIEWSEVMSDPKAPKLKPEKEQ